MLSACVPAKPTNLSAKATSDSTILVSWTDASFFEGGFEIERKEAEGEFALIATVSANIVSYADSGLTPLTTYTYRVRAYHESDYSAYSNEAAATTLDENQSAALIIDHTSTALSSIPSAWIAAAKSYLHIAYGHTSHGSQLTTGMTGLAGWKGTLYAYNTGGSDGALDLRDTPFSGASDLGNPDRTSWAAATRTYLTTHPEVNVVIWSWCGQVSSATAADITTYLTLMSQLEQEYPGVNFVYMTGHLDGTGLTGNLHLRNEQIREYCRANGKILYDFADIETYNPDGVFFGDKIPNDNCDYDSDGNGSLDKNWAIDWENAHVKGVDWYDCTAAHTQPLNANLKAYAAWWLWARIAGWEG